MVKQRETMYEKKCRVIAVLTFGLQPIHQIRKNAGIDHYQTFKVLEELVTEGKAEKSMVVRKSMLVPKYRKSSSSLPLNSPQNPHISPTIADNSNPLDNQGVRK